MGAGITAKKNCSTLEKIMSEYPSMKEYLIPILQAIQEVEGYLSKESIYAVAEYLKLPESKIYGVATFYNQFKLTPPGRFQVQICRGTACHVKGSSNILEILKTELGIGIGETTKDGFFSLDTVACLGACSIAPVVKVNEEFYGKMDSRDKVKKLVKELRANALQEGGK